MRLNLKKRLIKTLIWSVLLYGAEAWSLRKNDVKKLEAFEMWIWRRIEKILWKDHISNKEVLKRVKGRRSLIETIVRRKQNWISHVLRGCGILKEINEGRFEGKRSRGRKRIGMFDSLLKGENFEIMKRNNNRVSWCIWTSGTCL